MKRFVYVLLACVLVACTFTSCDLGLGGEIIEDESLIIGKWRSRKKKRKGSGGNCLLRIHR